MDPKTIDEAHDSYIQCYRAIHGTAPRKSSCVEYDVNKLRELIKHYVENNNNEINEIEKTVKVVEARALLPKRLVLSANFPIEAVIGLEKNQASIMYHNYAVDHDNDEINVEELSVTDLH